MKVDGEASGTIKSGLIAKSYNVIAYDGNKCRSATKVSTVNQPSGNLLILIINYYD